MVLVEAQTLLDLISVGEGQRGSITIVPVSLRVSGPFALVVKVVK